MTLKKGETVNSSFKEDVRAICVETGNAKAAVRTAQTDSIEITYTAESSGKEFSASVEDGVLCVKERGKPFSLGIKSSALEIVLPAAKYESFSIKAASGNYEICELTCGKFSAETASGNGKYLISADEINISAGSGNSELRGFGDGKTKSLNINSASGNHTVIGLRTENFRINSASGNIDISGISGRGSIETASGNVSVEYAGWDDDLSIQAMSGNTKIKLPEGSGAEIELKAAAGKLVVDLDGNSSKFSGNCSCTVGGSNVHKISAVIMSGSVRLSN